MAENQQFKILVVDDEPDIRSLLAPRFSKAGFLTVACEDGEQALKKLTEERFDAIITDINMPKINGVELVAKTKMNSLNRGIHVFVMSGAADQTVIVKLAQLGIAEIVAKPFSVDALVKRIYETLVSTHERRKLPKQQVLDCFFRGVVDVLQYYSHKTFEFGKIEINNTTSLSGDVSASISFSGNGIIGFTSLILTQSFVDFLEERLFGNSNFDIDYSMIADLVGEMCNQMMGRAQQHLRQLGIELAIGLPNVCVGSNHTTFQRSRIPIVVVPILSEGKTACHFEVCITSTAAVSMSQPPRSTTPAESKEKT